MQHTGYEVTTAQQKMVAVQECKRNAHSFWKPGELSGGLLRERNTDCVREAGAQDRSSM
jgi:hypothetical protein